MSAPRQRFLDLLRPDVLELDAAELDFGIHRVLSRRRTVFSRSARVVWPDSGGAAC